MNIFVLDNDPQVAAQYHCDQHMKMILEYAQLLSTAHRVIDGDEYVNSMLYKKTHVNHPCAKWVRTNRSNYEFVWKLFYNLGVEFRTRRHKDHGSFTKLVNKLSYYPKLLPSGDMTPFVQCMPDEYKVDNDAVMAYRNFYKDDKARFATWNWGRPMPKWMEDK